MFHLWADLLTEMQAEILARVDIGTRQCLAMTSHVYDGLYDNTVAGWNPQSQGHTRLLMYAHVTYVRRMFASYKRDPWPPYILAKKLHTSALCANRTCTIEQILDILTDTFPGVSPPSTGIMDLIFRIWGNPRPPFERDIHAQLLISLVNSNRLRDFQMVSQRDDLKRHVTKDMEQYVLECLAQLGHVDFIIDSDMGGIDQYEILIGFLCSEEEVDWPTLFADDGWNAVWNSLMLVYDRIFSVNVRQLPHVWYRMPETVRAYLISDASDLLDEAFYSFDVTLLRFTLDELKPVNLSPEYMTHNLIHKSREVLIKKRKKLLPMFQCLYDHDLLRADESDQEMFDMALDIACYGDKETWLRDHCV